MRVPLGCVTGKPRTDSSSVSTVSRRAAQRLTVWRKRSANCLQVSSRGTGSGSRCGLRRQHWRIPGFDQGSSIRGSGPEVHKRARRRGHGHREGRGGDGGSVPLRIRVGGGNLGAPVVVLPERGGPTGEVGQKTSAGNFLLHPTLNCKRARDLQDGPVCGIHYAVNQNGCTPAAGSRRC